MPNDFEKQVRQKMDELDFVPGEPVWTKIEAQIRSKKDRRRVIFWLPLFVLLAGGGALWLNQGNGDNDTLPASQPVSTVPPGSTGKENVPASIVSVPGENEQTVAGGNKKEINTETIDPVSSSVNFPGTNKTIIFSRKTANTAHDKNNVKNETTAPVDQNVTATSGLTPGGDKNNPGENKNGAAVLLVPVTEKGSTSKPEISNQLIIEKEISEQGKKDSAVINKPDTAKVVVVQPTQKQNSKWRIAIAGGAGVSGLAEGLTVLNTDKSMDAFTAGNLTSSPPPLQAPPQPEIKNGFSFSLGAAAVKQLSEKFRFTAGLEYNYLSNQMQVGNDSAGMIRAYSPLMTNSSTANNYYSNHYHFISLPVDIAFRPLKKLALDVSAGLSLQQLVATDAIVYKSQYSAYVNDKESFTKTQLFTRFGLNYSVDINKHSLLFGPQLSYGLSSLLKNDDDKHLFSFGLRTSFVF